MIDKTQGVFVPPPAGEGEVALNVLEEHVFSKTRAASTFAALLGMPIVLDAVLSVGQFSKVISKTGRTARYLARWRACDRFFVVSIHNSPITQTKSLLHE